MHDQNEQLLEYTYSVTYLIHICELICIQLYFHFKLCQSFIVDRVGPVMMLSVFEIKMQNNNWLKMHKAS